MTENERQRVIHFLRELDDACCDRREHFAGGVATLSDRELARVMTMNQLRVELLAERLSVKELRAETERLAAEAERLLGSLYFRRIVAYDEEIGARLALGFEQMEDWATERVVLMAQHRPLDRAVDTSFVREVDLEQLEPVRTRFLRDRVVGDEERVRQEVVVARRLAAVGELLCFAAAVGDEIVSFCELYSDDSGVAVIRSVATLAEHRGKGFARATISRALARSHSLAHDLTFLRAVHADWPKNLYGRLGFDAIGMMYRFTRRLSQSD